MRTPWMTLVAALVLATGARAEDAPAAAPPAQPSATPEPAPPPPKDARRDPEKNEVPLPALAGWDASLVYDNDVGVWTVQAMDIFEQFGCPEIVGLDDKGRCTILQSYSGKWTRYDTVGDQKWLGGLAHGDLDPRRAGRELYTGGQNGNLYQVVPHDGCFFSVNLIATIPGREIHTLVLGDLDPSREGSEMLLFTRPGGMYLVTPKDEPGVTFDVTLLDAIPGRVRDAVLLPAAPGAAPEVAVACRTGEIATVRLGPSGRAPGAQTDRIAPGGTPQGAARQGFVWTKIHQREMGFGRLALRPAALGAQTVLYSCCDDGVVLRHERGEDGTWRTGTVYAGPQGVRGVIAGRFDADPSKETIAVFGYSKKVQVLTREKDGWRAETIFEDRDKGHWLAAAELDGRNGTTEIISSGYGCRVVLLARPPGYGLPGVATDPDLRPSGR